MLEMLDPIIRDPHSGEYIDFDKEMDEVRAAVAELMNHLDVYLKGQEEEIDSDYHWIRRDNLRVLLDRIQDKE